MSEYCFGGGSGWLSTRAEKAAKREGAELCNFTDAQCLCGGGCRPHTCPESRRHWFAVPNRGWPFDQEVEARVMAAVMAVATKRDKELFEAKKRQDAELEKIQRRR